MSKVRLGSTSFLMPGNRVWAGLSRMRELAFCDYGAWSSALLESRDDDDVAVVLFLDDVMTPQAISLEESIKVFESFFGLLKNRLENSSGLTIVAFSSCDHGNLIRRARVIDPVDQVHQWFMSQVVSLCKDYSSLYKIDLNKEFGKIGYQHSFDSRNWYAARCRLSNDGLSLLATSIEQICVRHDGPASKVLVLDCDNTLWGGVVGEDGVAGLTLGQDGVGQAFVDFQISAKSLIQQGIVLAIASKNNESDVWEVFDNHKSMVLERSDIVSWKINWEDKARNIRELSQELDLGLDSFVFWDDNPMERDRVINALPEVHTIIPPDDVVEWSGHLDESICFAKFTVTEDDQRKTDQYHRRAQFVSDSSDIVDERSYLRSIKLQPEAIAIDKGNISRAVQLCAKTNQYNLRTVRHGEIDITRFIDEDPRYGFLVRLRDIYGDHGVVGLVCLARITPDIAFLDTFLMSCRVLGRHLEAWMLYEAIERARKSGYQFVIGQYIPTERNIVAKECLTDHGFSSLSESTLSDGEIEGIHSVLDSQELYALSTANPTIPFLDIYEID